MSDAILTNNKTGKKFIFQTIAPFKNKKSQPTVSVPIIGTTPDNTFLFRFSGQIEVVTFTFALYDDGTDVSGGTNSTAVTSLDDQVVYLRDTVYGASYDTDWDFWQPRYYSTNVKVNIEDLEFDQAPGAGTVVTGTITLKRGNIGGI